MYLNVEMGDVTHGLLLGLLQGYPSVWGNSSTACIHLCWKHTVFVLFRGFSLALQADSALLPCRCIMNHQGLWSELNGDDILPC